MNLIRAHEAALILGVVRETVWRWARDGELSRAFVIGNESFFDRSYIERVARDRKAKLEARKKVAA